MRLFRVLAITLAIIALGGEGGLTQTSTLTTLSIQATSPLDPGIADATGMWQNAATANPGSANPTACSSANPSTSALPTFDGGGLYHGTTAASNAMGAQGGTPAPCGGMSGYSAATSASGITAATTSASSMSTAATTSTTATTATASAADPSSLGLVGLGTSGLGTAGLGTTGLGSVSAGSGSMSQATSSLATADASAAACAVTPGTMSGTPGMNIGHSATASQSASGTVADAAQNLPNSIPEPAQTLGGAASLPAELAPTCTNTP